MSKIENNMRVISRLSILGEGGENLFILTYDGNLTNSNDLFIGFNHYREDSEAVEKAEKENRYITIVYGITYHYNKNKMKVYHIIPTNKELAERILSPLDKGEISDINNKILKFIGYDEYLYHIFTGIQLFEQWQTDEEIENFERW